MLNISRRVIKEGWLLKSRDNFLPFPPFKSKWSRRYFVLRNHDFDRDKHILDEYRNEDKTRLVESWDLEIVSQLEAYLSVSRRSLSCSNPVARSRHKWIFAVFFKPVKSNRVGELYLVAETENEMNDWVGTICRVCGMAPQETREHEPSYNKPIRVPLPPQGVANNNSISSSVSLDSMLDIPSDVTSEDRRGPNQGRPTVNYLNVKRLAKKSRNRQREQRNHSDSLELPAPSSSASIDSYSSRKTTEDDMSSVGSQSGPPIPPRRLRRDFQLDQIVRPIMQECIDERADQESSGETIKTRIPSNSVSTPPNYAPSISSSDLQYEVPISSTLPSRSKPKMPRGSVFARDDLPPPVDRSSKPNKFRDPDDLLYVNSSAKKTSSLNRVPQSAQYNPVPHPRGPPRSAGLIERRQLDYFEPKEIERTLQTEKNTTIPADIDYIRVDMKRTLAIKNSGHERKTTD